MKDLQNLQDVIGEWSDKTVPTTLEGVLLHLIEEAEDLQNDPYNSMNYADVLILLITAARKAGYTISELTKAVEVKHTLNTNREWLDKNEKGIRRHK